jgi:diguanylate cyclase
MLINKFYNRDTTWRHYKMTKDDKSIGQEIKEPYGSILQCNCNEGKPCATVGFLMNIIDNSSLVINVWDMDGDLIRFNRFSQELTGFAESEVLGKGWENTFINVNNREHFKKVFKEICSGKAAQIQEGRIYCKSGEAKYLLWSNFIASDNSGKPLSVISIGIDITDRKKAEEQSSERFNRLQEMHGLLRSAEEQLNKQLAEQQKLYEALEHSAYYDPLTSLGNRALLNEKLGDAIRNAELNKCYAALILMDLDNFKKVNDNYGHNFGDELLCAVGKQLRSCVGGKGLAARVGGDEFAVLLPYLKKINEASEECQKILEIFRKPFVLNGRELHVTASIGVSMYPGDGEELAELYRNADIAAYSAKENGGNSVAFFHKHMLEEITEKLSIEEGLRRALRNDEFILHYQPLVDTSTRKIIGVETLVRWNHPVKGMIPPVKFIPIAEETGLIIPIGEWVLRRACHQYVLWKNKAVNPGTLAVNISVRQFEKPEFLKVVKAILEETGMEAKDLEFEITETIAMKDLEHSIKVLMELKALGIRVALDDFGTGFSSLNYLKKLPIQTLKIDKSFIDNVTLDNREDTVVQAVIAIAQKMGLNIIAEGVETEDQLDFLKKEKCSIVQGYLFSKPLAVEGMEDLLVHRQI